MGMDVFGKNPTSEKGKYFRNNVWWWRPLANYVCEVAPDITSNCLYWHSNDGDGLDSSNARLLANKLNQEVLSGRTKLYEEKQSEYRRSLPDESCKICAGTGKRLEPPNCGAGNMPCNGCKATGKVRPYEAEYPFTEQNVKEFIEFLQDCGGFDIC